MKIAKTRKFYFSKNIPNEKTCDKHLLLAWFIPIPFLWLSLIITYSKVHHYNDEVVIFGIVYGVVYTVLIWSLILYAINGHIL